MRGVIKRFFDQKNYGFIDVVNGDCDIFFHLNALVDQDRVPIWEGEPVAFDTIPEKKQDGSPGLRARNVRRLSRLSNWAFFPCPDALYELKQILLDEPWEFAGAKQDNERPFPILLGYLRWTFYRLQREGKIVESRRGDGVPLAAFNTGLVDKRYEPIYALFVPNTRPTQFWEFAQFCIAGEKQAGKDLVRYFKPLPEPAHYFDKVSDLIYDTDEGEPEVDWEHVIVHNIGRLPPAFLQQHCPPGFTMRDRASIPIAERAAYLRRLGEAVRNSSQTYRAIMNRLKDAVELSIKRTRWNFKTAIPMYYPTQNHMNLLLPVSLVSDEAVDIALVVEKTPSGNYLGHTILPLDLAYGNARLVCRPDSDWLVPKSIAQTTVEELEDANEEEAMVPPADERHGDENG